MLKNMKGVLLQVAPKEIRFTQDSIFKYFDGLHAGKEIYDAVKLIFQGELLAAAFPIMRVCLLEDRLWTLDNRRLWVFRKARVDVVTVKLAGRFINQDYLPFINSYLYRLMLPPEYFPQIRGPCMVDFGQTSSALPMGIPSSVNRPSTGPNRRSKHVPAQDLDSALPDQRVNPPEKRESMLTGEEDSPIGNDRKRIRPKISIPGGDRTPIIFREEVPCEERGPSPERITHPRRGKEEDPSPKPFVYTRRGEDKLSPQLSVHSRLSMMTLNPLFKPIANNEIDQEAPVAQQVEPEDNLRPRSHLSARETRKAEVVKGVEPTINIHPRLHVATDADMDTTSEQYVDILDEDADRHENHPSSYKSEDPRKKVSRSGFRSSGGTQFRREHENIEVGHEDYFSKKFEEPYQKKLSIPGPSRIGGAKLREYENEARHVYDLRNKCQEPRKKTSIERGGYAKRGREYTNEDDAGHEDIEHPRNKSEEPCRKLLRSVPAADLIKGSEHQRQHKNETKADVEPPSSSGKRQYKRHYIPRELSRPPEAREIIPGNEYFVHVHNMQGKGSTLGTQQNHFVGPFRLKTIMNKFQSNFTLPSGCPMSPIINHKHIKFALSDRDVLVETWKDDNQSPTPVPEKLLMRRKIREKVKGTDRMRAAHEYLVKWRGESEKDGTWQPASILDHYPSLRIHLKGLPFDKTSTKKPTRYKRTPFFEPEAPPRSKYMK